MSNESNLVKFGNRLKEYRKLKKLTQAQLAELVGVSTNFIGMVERAKRNTTIDKMFKIVEALNVSLSAFFKDM